MADPTMNTNTTNTHADVSCSPRFVSFRYADKCFQGKHEVWPPRLPSLSSGVRGSFCKELSSSTETGALWNGYRKGRSAEDLRNGFHCGTNLHLNAHWQLSSTLPTLSINAYPIRTDQLSRKHEDVGQGRICPSGCLQRYGYKSYVRYTADSKKVHRRTPAPEAKRTPLHRHISWQSLADVGQRTEHSTATTK